MSVIPTGAPAWLRTNGFDSYGGDLNKKNFASRGAINPKTDVSAEAFSRITADLAALARVAPFAELTFLCDDSTPADPTVEWVSMMTGVRAVSYAGNSPPSGFPSVTRNGTGDVTVAFSASYADDYGVVGSLALKSPVAQLVGSTAGTAVAQLASSSSVRVRVFNLSNVALASQRVSLVVGSGS